MRISFLDVRNGTLGSDVGKRHIFIFMCIKMFVVIYAYMCINTYT
jgi:hypothetical protein